MLDSYRGRFAPSPTGPLHLGSMLTAVGSYLQAKSHNGKWLVRIEDIDPPREVPGASASILNTLERFGLHWDEEVIYQSQRASYYEEALSHLTHLNLIYPCCCSRKVIQQNGAKRGKIGYVYPGTCQLKQVSLSEQHSIRLKVLNENCSFVDYLQGTVTQSLISEIGDIILKRADDLYAYHLAVVVDDYLQEITEIVRGFDLLENTPIQIYLQQCLGYHKPNYLHLPIVINEHQEKLSKQTGAKSVEQENPESTLVLILQLLNLNPPPRLAEADKHEILKWGIRHWRMPAQGTETVLNHT